MDRKLVYLSELVYQDWNNIESNLDTIGFKLLQKFDHEETQGMLVSDNKRTALGIPHVGWQKK